jgi:hypothetical protein
MKQETAIEWLVRVLELESFENINLYSMKAIEQAKEMEKEQIIDAVNNGWRQYDGKTYYNKTYTKNESKTNI